MKAKTYNKTKKAIISYLKNKEMFCFRKRIIRDLVKAGHKKTNVSNTLRIMRKNKEIKKGLRRWGL